METKIILEDLIFDLSDGSQVIAKDNIDHNPAKFNLYTASGEKIVSDRHMYCTTKDHKSCEVYIKTTLFRIGVCDDIVGKSYRFLIQGGSHKGKRIYVCDVGKNAIRLY